MGLHTDIIELFQDQGFLQTADLVDPGFSIRQLAGRQKVRQIIGPEDQYVVKETSTSGPRGSPAYEANLYRELSQVDESDRIVSHHVPAIVWSDQAGLLILESVGGRYLAEAIFEGNQPIRTNLATSFGELIAEIHLMPYAGDTELSGQEWRYSPSIFEHLVPDANRYLALTGAQVEVLRTVQRFPDLLRALEELRRDWNDLTLIHGDLSLSNVLVRNGPLEIVILDWELAGLGDPCWDVGTVLADWLGHWISSIPVVSGVSVNRLVQTAESLHRIVVANAQHFWRAYSTTMKLDRITEQAWLVSAIRFAGLRLFQKAMEHGYYLAMPTGHEQLLMQLGMNLTLAPEQAASDLFERNRSGE